MEIDEQNAVRDCQKGEYQAFGILYDAYIKKIYGFVFYRIRHKEIAEDLTSIIFTKALENMGSFNLSKAGFSTWLYRIARNTIIDHYRTNKPTDDLTAAYDVSSAQNVEKEVDARVNLEKVQKYLAALPEETRDVVTMRVWDGLSYKEISEILGKSEGSIKISFSRTLQKMNAEIPIAALYLILLKM
ncbi:MAG: hypothetical protein COT92_01825 [Candidatus Doudnabacteria bacterium CG10_big_fil_rev_8_21_14_0_10_42_18]|uniref:RNA polymerase subunit sigma-24 n=1 Tax=Candidatus Doudnabacteria bacterium CG10_big_fil_rev_8_21_14_0_10_42_18 TaxID=1974552 RepID=A0A2H0VB20_9BACT|nr:MAG: hypothetical protein COT92_01825 [Candidatus Doudnabacteria bacterium CG10_big_fil_rev_8_21_14_0_10_42_18]